MTDHIYVGLSDKHREQFGREDEDLLIYEEPARSVKITDDEWAIEVAKNSTRVKTILGPPEETFADRENPCDAWNKACAILYNLGFEPQEFFDDGSVLWSRKRHDRKT